MSDRSPITSAGPANFAAHLAALMRAQGMSAEELAQKSGAGRAGTGIALRPTVSRCVSLDTADRLANAVGGDLPAMLGPYTCPGCRGNVPAGFTCNECGARGGES